ncbi:S-layer homology domain-containing protein [Geminocystis sp. GBBB08]|uniref:S-layer homology domain-containing protein n=1 Tax=Geminocystis sp. GBBB08 TaxID=2604140 RepID=UPI0027E25D62|nr:S-layer homology domain-containing protein [Geminocystis sp. GBBB08]MBL1209080.1 S-layer homology domain-containing protein [Geminocystis sp. GBBB08]
MILFRYILFSVLIVLLTGCSGNQALESRFAPNPQLKSDTNSSTNINAQTQNPVKIPDTEKNSVKLPDDFPSDIPIYSQAKLITVDGKQTIWTSDDPLNLITEYYKQELTAKKWTISQSEENLIIASKPDQNQSLKLSLIPSNGQTEFTLTYETTDKNIISTTPLNPENTNPLPSTTININESSSNLDELVRLEISSTTEKLKPHQIITRREYARWLVKINNLIYADVNSKLIRLANPESKPIFTDIPENDPDFPIIQGLAEAGLIPSSLTQDNNAITFQPDKPLTREDLISWKVPLDFRQKLPNATLDTIKETWGFQDAAKIKPQAWRQLYIDWQNGEDSNVRRGFSYITLFQPQKPVTYDEAARILNAFGYQGDIRNLKEVKKQV